MKRILYLAYYIKKLDLSQFKKFLSHASIRSNRSKIALLLDCLYGVFKYNISILEYFQFEFDLYKDSAYRSQWAGTGFMYEYQLVQNPPAYRSVLDNKVEFAKTYHEFIYHEVLDIDEDLIDQKLKVLFENYEVLVLKDPFGKCGTSIEFYETGNSSPQQLLRYMRNKGLSMIETPILQHKDLNHLSPSGVNTIRVITTIDETNKVRVLAARLRISVDNKVDNLAAGNLAAVIDLNTGKVTDKAVYSDITKQSVSVHPITSIPILGFQVPFWKEVLEMCRSAAKINSNNKSIGWDVVITEKGPSLIEGNHDWCKLLWQLPAKRGLRSDILSKAT